MKKALSILLAFTLMFGLLPLNAAGSPRESEPNDSVNQANPITVNQDMYGNIESRSDIDYYVFTLSNKGSVSLTFNYLSGQPGHRLRLYDSANSQLQDRTFISTSDVFPYTMNKLRLPSGTYYIRLERYSNDAFNDYSIRVNYTDESSGNYESESNGSVGLANPITNGVPITGHIESSGDVDCYSFSLGGNGS
ncbi:MAG: hypothetical protein FWH01_16885, partial [Oscillospiraceae bacterium]|nr:hypothetical protein [Oscillospiraceae bacterium]